MRILIIADNWMPHVCGFTRTFDSVVRELERDGDEVHVIHHRHFPSLPVPTYPELRFPLASPARLGRMIDRIAPDAVHIALEGSLGLSARTWCRKAGIRFTTSFTTDWPAYVNLRFPIPQSATYGYLRWFHAGAERCMVSTRSMRSRLEARGFRNMVHWGRGVDTELFRPDRNRKTDGGGPVFLYVGRVAPEKNVTAFLDLALPGTKVVVGTGPQLRTLAARYPGVRFTGALSGEELATEYASADCLVFPSRTDTFGLVMLEALACGVPVAAFPVQGPDEVIGRSGVGVLGDDLQRAALEAILIPRDRCRAYAEQFSWRDSAHGFRNALVSARQPAITAEAGA